jgi:hypothetical protein
MPSAPRCNDGARANATVNRLLEEFEGNPGGLAKAVTADLEKLQ